jgi:hypothetical protein
MVTQVLSFAKPAPFAERKTAKSAASPKAKRGVTEFRCRAKGFATRRFREESLRPGMRAAVDQVL